MSDKSKKALIDAANLVNEEFEEIAGELAKAMTKHPTFPTLMHAFGVVYEEYTEVEREFMRQDFNKEALKKELRHLAAMCLRTIIDLEL